MTLVYTVRPISDRTPFTGKPVDSQFTATWSDTRADAKAHSGAVRVAFDSKHGPLQYATDRFQRPYWQRKGAREDWQHNVRAIALGLEALRKVDRYGITKRGEQYAGWKALPPGGGIAMPAAMTVEQAARFIIDQADSVDPGTDAMIVDEASRQVLYRRAARRLHPDRGGDPAMFHRLQEARELLDRHGGRS